MKNQYKPLVGDEVVIICEWKGHLGISVGIVVGIDNGNFVPETMYLVSISDTNKGLYHKASDLMPKTTTTKEKISKKLESMLNASTSKTE